MRATPLLPPGEPHPFRSPVTIRWHLTGTYISVSTTVDYDTRAPIFRHASTLPRHTNPGYPHQVTGGDNRMGYGRATCLDLVLVFRWLARESRTVLVRRDPTWVAVSTLL